jgi:hypothetical protein
VSWALGKAGTVTHTLIAARADLPPVTVTFNAQPTLLSARAAREAAQAVFRAGGPKVTERAGDAFSAAIIRWNIVSWTGIGDGPDSPVEPTHDVEKLDEAGKVIGVELGTISAFLAESRLVDAADREYVLPWVLADMEKNGWSPSLDGTSSRATQVPDTVSSPATQESSVDATTTTDAPPAPTSKRSRKRKPAKASGG